VTGEGRRDAAAEELALAAEELRVAEQLLGTGHHRIALTRVYFAVFHTVRARLYAENLEPRSHGGVLHLWSVHFVQTGRYQPATSRLLSRLQKFRQEADYARAFVIDEAGAREELAAARSLLESIREELA
jgi:uncharacterized protein (UPF0332 family)